MRNTITLPWILAIAAMAASPPAFARDGESIVFNPATGNYRITYYDDDSDAFRQITFIPRTKITPIFKTRLKFVSADVIHYEYVLANGRGSQQDIDDFGLYPVSSVATDTPIPPIRNFSGDMTPEWMKSIQNAAEATTKAEETFDTPAHWAATLSGGMSVNGVAGPFSVGWYYRNHRKDAGGLPPGERTVFGFKSRDLPGIIKAKLSGFAPDSEEIPGENTQDANDGGFGQQYTALTTTRNFVYRLVAAPAIAVPAPFDAAALLDRIQAQMHTWIGMKLLDPTFSSQLDRNLAAAADSYRHAQPKAAKEDLEQVREMLKKEHPDMGRDEEHESASNREKNDDKKPAMIDLLAARVLDFNLVYVLKRAEEGKEGKGKD